MKRHQNHVVLVLSEVIQILGNMKNLRINEIRISRNTQVTVSTAEFKGYKSLTEGCQ